jgi:hypothetical protein
MNTDHLQTEALECEKTAKPISFVRLILWIAVIAVAIFVLSGCMTETTRTITTDKEGTITDTTVTRKGSDPAALKLVEVAAAVYVPRHATVVREEKSGPIIPSEIANRWKP